MKRENEKLDKSTIDFLVRNGLLDRNELNEILRKMDEAEQKLEDMGSCINAYIKYLKEEESKDNNTTALYRRYAEAFLKYYFGTDEAAEFEQKKLGLITLKTYENWLEYLPTVGYTETSLKQFKSGAAKFFDYLNKRGYNLPDIREIKLEYGAKEIDAIRDDEIRQIAECAKSGRGKALILFIYETGIKRNELVYCKKSHIDFEKGIVNIYKKDRIARVGYLSEEVSKLIQQYIKEWELEVIEINEGRLTDAAVYNKPYVPVKVSEYLFQTYMSEQVSYATIQREIYAAVQEYCFRKRAAGQPVTEFEERISSETLRHSRRVYYLSEGMPLEQVRSLLGDDSTAITTRFLPIAQRLYPEKFKQ